MNLKVELDLDELMTHDNWGTTVGEIIKDELKDLIRNQIKRDIKNDTKLQRVIKEYKNRAVREAMEKLGLK